MEDGDRHTLGLLLELRDLAREASEANDTLASRFQDLLRIAKAAFETARKIYPNDRLVLLWGKLGSSKTAVRE